MMLAAPAWQRGGRLMWRAVAAIFALLMALLLAWAGCNLVDSRPLPTPPALALPAVPADTPLNLALMQLLNDHDGKTRLRTMQGALLACAPTDDCTQRWTAGAAQLAPRLAEYATLGERCLAAAANTRFAEPLPAVMTPATPMAPHALAASQCSQWLTLAAVAAAHAGRHDEALERLAQGGATTRALLSGSQSLIASAVAWTVARRHYQGVAAVLALQPGWAPELLPLSAALPADALAPQRWVASEAAWQRGVVADLPSQCGQAEPEMGGALHWMVCKLGLGLLPEVTRQDIDARWLQRLASAQAGEKAVVGQGEPTPMSAWAFRNTVGRLLLSLADANYAGYFARQADVDLQRQTLGLATAMTAQQVPIAARADWLRRQTLSPPLQARIMLTADGTALDARPWASDAEPGAAARPIHVPLPAL
jgi:hypothetical protein